MKQNLAERFRAIIHIARNGGEMSRELIETRCNRGAEIARQMRFSEAVAGAILDLDAHWPGLLDGSTPFDWFFKSPDGESYDAAFLRAESWLRERQGVTVAVSHGLVSRIIRGAYSGLSKAEALSLPVPQDVIWRLSNGRIEPISVG